MDNIEYSMLPKKSVKVVKGGLSALPEKSIGSLIISDLLPFKQIMKKQLKRRGFYVDGMDFKTLVSLYYNEFASNQYNKQNNLIPINQFDFINNVAFKIKPSDKINGNINHRNINNFESINDVVNGIIGIFKRSKEKMISSGSNFDTELTDEEIQQAKAANKIEKNLENKIIDNQSIKIKDVKSILFIGLVLYVLYTIFK
jgi:hypothetical protein